MKTPVAPGAAVPPAPARVRGGAGVKKTLVVPGDAVALTPGHGSGEEQE